MVEEHRVHGFTQSIVATESERQVADSATHMASGQVKTYPARGFDEIERIPVMSLYASGHGQYVGVEDDVRSGHAHDIHQQTVSPIRAFLRGGMMGIAPCLMTAS